MVLLITDGRSQDQVGGISQKLRNDGVEVRGKISVTNCTFEGGEGFALQFAGANSLIENNLFQYNDWTGHDIGNGGTVFSQSHSTGDHFRHKVLNIHSVFLQEINFM